MSSLRHWKKNALYSRMYRFNTLIIQAPTASYRLIPLTRRIRERTKNSIIHTIRLAKEGRGLSTFPRYMLIGKYTRYLKGRNSANFLRSGGNRSRGIISPAEKRIIVWSMYLN